MSVTPSCPPSVARVCCPMRRSTPSTAIRSLASVTVSRRRQGEPGAARHQVELAQVDAASNRGRICEQPGAAGRRVQPAGKLSNLLAISGRDERADVIVVDREFARGGIAAAVDDLDARAGADGGRRRVNGRQPAVLERQRSPGVQRADRDLVDCEVPGRQCQHAFASARDARERAGDGAFQLCRSGDRHRHAELTWRAGRGLPVGARRARQRGRATSTGRTPAATSFQRWLAPIERARRSCPARAARRGWPCRATLVTAGCVPRDRPAHAGFPASRRDRMS